MTGPELQALKARVEAEEARQNGRQLPENRTAEADGGSNAKEPQMCKVSKPYKNRDKWRVRVIDTLTGAIKNHIYPTEDEAKKARVKLLREYRRPVGVPMNVALAEYETHLKTRGNVKNRPNKPRTVETTMQRLRGVFTTDIVTGDLSAKTMVDLWDEWVKGKATDTALNTLAQVRTFLGGSKSSNGRRARRCWTTSRWWASGRRGSRSCRRTKPNSW
jgi:hypothetical protein